ncbi:MAG: 4Fe-4S binding protein [Dehalococcoidales bacterium]|jgi:ferredoxin
MKLVLNPEKCTGCKICELACSARHQGVFNPVKSHLKIINTGTDTHQEKKLKSCILCLDCVNSCPQGAISFNGKWLTVEGDLCTGCANCVEACPQSVIYMNRDKAAVPDFCQGAPSCVAWCPHQAITKEEDAA